MLHFLGELHLATLLVTIVVILLGDHHAFGYLRGTRALLTKSFVTWTHRLVWVGLIGMTVTGISLAIPRWSYLSQEPAFFVKMGFVLALYLNAFFIGRLSSVATERPWSALTSDERRTFYVSGALSGIGWVGAALIGFVFL